MYVVSVFVVKRFYVPLKFKFATSYQIWYPEIQNCVCVGTLKQCGHILGDVGLQPGLDRV